MNTRRHARELVEDLCERSDLAVQVGAVLMDRNGRLVSWGWNHLVANPRGNSKSCHAEEHAFSRANPERLRGARLIVAGRRRKSGNWITARPCESLCMGLARKHGVKTIEYVTPGGTWSIVRLE